MPYSPLISKIRCHNPNRSRSRLANRNYLTYIATREGVDISKIDDINDLMKNENILNKDLNEDIVYTQTNNDNYLKYMAKRPRSHGLFGSIDTTDLDKIASEVSHLTKQGKNIYRGIISLSEKDAEALGYVNKDKWNTYLKLVMPDVAKELGVSISDFTWVAAFHAEKTHPHIHFELWDNTNKIKSPYIDTSVQNKCRILLSKAMFNEEYDNVLKDVYKLEREELNSIRNRSRDELTNSIKEIMDFTDLNNLFVPGTQIEKLPARITAEDLKKLSNELSKLVDVLPIKGSVDYAYLPSEVKDKVNKITDILLERNDLKKALLDYLEAVGEGQKLLGKTKFDISIAKEKAQKDIEKRIANIILKRAKYLKEFDGPNEINIKSDFDQHDNMHSFSNQNISNNQIVNYNVTDDNIVQNYDNTHSTEFIEDPDYDNNIYHNNDDIFIDWTDRYKESLSFLYDPKKQNFDKAYELLKEEANIHNVLAIHDLGKMFEKGLGRDIDLKMANHYYSLALNGFMMIENNKPTKYLEYRIGKLFDAGKGTDQDFNTAGCWYEKSAYQNYKYAEYSLGMLYRNNKISPENNDNNEKAFDLLHKSADKGFSYAAYEVGKMYEQGLGTERDKNQSDHFYKLAFNGFLKMSYEREDDNLMYRIGKMYCDGIGVDADENKAIEYLEKSANLNNVNAQFLLAKLYIKSNNQKKIEESIKMLTKLSNANNDMAQYFLGKIYLEGNSVEKNEVEAFNLLHKAADQGNQYAQYQLGKLYYDGSDIEKNIDKAIDYFKAAADQNNEFAQYSLGKILSDKNSGYYNIQDAVSWYTKSAEQGNQFAQYQLGKLYYDGSDIEKNIDKAIDYFKAAADQNNEFAQYSLGKILSDKNSGYYNIQDAVSWYTKSAEQGNQFAQYQLGKLYLWGKDIEKNETLGLYWLQKAIDQNNEYAKHTLEAYKNYNDNIIPSVAYGLVKTSLNTICNQEQHAKALTDDRIYRSKSKQARKEAALHNKINDL